MILRSSSRSPPACAGGAACDVTFLHLYWPIEEYERLGLRGARDPLAPDPDVVKNLEPKLRARVGALPGHGDVKLLVRPAWGDPAANLLLAVGEESYDMLIVGAHQRHGLARVLNGSVAERVARHAARTPIVCVPTTVPNALPPVERARFPPS